MSLTLTKIPASTRLSLKKPGSYAIHVTSPLVPYILPLLFRDEVKAQGALDEVWASFDGSQDKFQCWLVSPDGRLMDYRGLPA